jgi:hypothetical protein
MAAGARALQGHSWQTDFPQFSVLPKDLQRCWPNT